MSLIFCISVLEPHFLFLAVRVSKDLHFTQCQVVVRLLDGNMSCYTTLAVNIVMTLTTTEMYHSTEMSPSVYSCSMNPLLTTVGPVPDTDTLDVVGPVEMYPPPVMVSLVVSGVSAGLVTIVP